MTTPLQYRTIMEQTIEAVQQLSTKFNKFEEDTKNDLKEIKEGLLGNKYNKKGLVDRTVDAETRISCLEDENEKIKDEHARIKAMFTGAKWSMGIAATIGAALFEFIWKVVLKQ